MLTTVVLGLLLSLQAQSNLNSYHYSAFGFNKAVTEINNATYSFEDKFADMASQESYKFNSEGYIIEKTFTVIKGYGSDTKISYQYDNGKIVSETKNVKQYPNFNSSTQYFYDANGNLSSYKVDGVYSSEFKNEYDKKNLLIKQLGFYGQSTSIEEYFYHKGTLIKSIKNYYKGDTITQTEQNLYHNGNIIVSYFDDYLEVTLKTNNMNQTIVIDATKDELIKSFSNIENFIKKNNDMISFEKYIKNYPASKIISECIYKNNTNNDWIACRIIDKEITNKTSYKFQEIKYLDSTVSGSIDFNIFDVNELLKK